MSQDYNYLVNTKCPWCGKKLLVSISGFGGELSVRVKQCQKCNREFYVHLLTSTSISSSISDGQISSMKDRIRYLNERRKEILSALLLRHEAAERMNREALIQAQKMRNQYESN